MHKPYIKSPVAALVCFGLMVAGTASHADDSKETSANLGLNFSDGNSDALTLHLGGRLADALENYAWHLTAEGNYGKARQEIVVGDETFSETEKTIQNAKGVAYARRQYDANYAYTDNVIFHDEMAGLDARLILGLGAGRQVLDQEALKMGLELGGSYVAEYYTIDDDDGYAAVRFGTRHEQRISETARWWTRAEYLPRIDDWQQYLIDAEVGIDAAINSHMSLRFVLQDNYNSRPAIGNERNDLSLIGAVNFMLYPSKEE